MSVVSVEALGRGEVSRPYKIAEFVLGSDGEFYRRHADGYRMPAGVRIRAAHILVDESPPWLEPLLFIRNQRRRLKRWLTRA